MELSQEETTVLKTQLEKSFADPSHTLEFEARFGLYTISKFKYKKNKLLREDFLRILKYFINESELGHYLYDVTNPETNTLDIWVWNGSRRLNIRHAITDIPTIIDYCKNNTIMSSKSRIHL